MSDIADRVKKIVVEHLGVETEKVTDNASFIDDFEIEIPDDAAENIQTFGDAVSFINKVS